MSDVISWMDAHEGTAAWVQAGGAILAIVIAIFVAYWQSKKQHEDTLKIQQKARFEEINNCARSLVSLGASVDRLFGSIMEKLPTVEALVQVANNKIFIERGEIQALEDYFKAMSILELPSQLVTEPPKLASMLRQFRENLTKALEAAASPNANANLAHALEVLGQIRGAAGEANAQLKTWAIAFIADQG